MRYVLVVGMLLCLFLSGCEFVTPDTSNALSQTRQQEELAKQTEQIKRQTDEIERLANSIEKLVNPQKQQ
jgi:hypothetical protein